jgi:arylsulfatase A-like enzyme
MGANYQRYLQNYLRCVASVDDSVRDVLDYLDKSGDAKNTIVIYASDQGLFLGENGWYDKRWFYEPSAGTPLIVRTPSGKKGKAVKSITSNVDLAPTILDLAGISAPSDMQGESLIPEIQGKVRKSRTAYGHFYESEDGDHNAPKYVALTSERYKLIFYYELAEWELFDLKHDKDEQHNIWSQKGSTVQGEMHRKLVARAVELDEDPLVLAKIRGSLPNSQQN